MKKTKSILSMLLILCMLLALCAGCSGKENSAVPSSVKTAESATPVSEMPEASKAPIDGEASLAEAEASAPEETAGPTLFDYELPITTDSPEYVFLVGL